MVNSQLIALNIVMTTLALTVAKRRNWHIIFLIILVTYNFLDASPRQKVEGLGMDLQECRFEFFTFPNGAVI